MLVPDQVPEQATSGFTVVLVCGVGDPGHLSHKVVTPGRGPD